MHAFAIFCKSFRGDIDRFARLLESLELHNREGLPLLLALPERDCSLFLGRFGCGRFELVSDEQLLGGRSPQSWRGQQVVKLHLYRARFAEAALIVDSDFYFIRDFGRADFITEAGVPRFIVSELCHTYDAANARLRAYLADPSPRLASASLTRETLAAAPPVGRVVLPSRLRRMWLALRSAPVDARIGRIQRAFGRRGPGIFVMPGPIWQSSVLERFFVEVLEPARLRADELIEYAPWEYHWYAEWQLRLGLSGCEPSEPMFLHFAREDAVRDARAAGLTQADFARHYLGVAMAARHHELLRY